MNNIFIYRNGQEYGPYSIEDVKGYLVSGNISDHDHARFSSEQEWMAVRDIIERGQANTQGFKQEITYQGVSSSTPNQPNEGRKDKSNLCLTLSLLSLLCCGPLLAVPAVILAHKERANGGGNGKTMAALFIGYFSIVFYVLVAILVGLAPDSSHEGHVDKSSASPPTPQITQTEDDSAVKVTYRAHGTVIQRLDNGYLVHAALFDKNWEGTPGIVLNDYVDSDTVGVIKGKDYFVSCDNPTLADDDAFDMMVYDTGKTISFPSALGDTRTVHVLKKSQ